MAIFTGELTAWERERNAKILAALQRRTKELEADPAQARAFLMRLGCWNKDGSLKEEWGGATAQPAPAVME